MDIKNDEQTILVLHGGQVPIDYNLSVITMIKE
jgi:hypothetical protein